MPKAKTKLEAQYPHSQIRPMPNGWFVIAGHKVWILDENEEEVWKGSHKQALFLLAEYLKAEGDNLNNEVDPGMS